jgi:hypothetical protein
MFEQCASVVHGVHVCVALSHCEAAASLQSLGLAHSTQLPVKQMGLPAIPEH